uniref:hypothetical protein n=1 Tax=Anaerococcus mediterraneensis TaxID=1870984 RepID=UPI000931BC25|nr:hypothetical protein [Anaerococcus mediterraneensis]
MESLMQKLSLVLASDSELWKDLLMPGTRTLDLVKALNGLLPRRLAHMRGEACVASESSFG